MNLKIVTISIILSMLSILNAKELYFTINYGDQSELHSTDKIDNVNYKESPISLLSEKSFSILNKKITYDSSFGTFKTINEAKNKMCQNSYLLDIDKAIELKVLSESKNNSKMYSGTGFLDEGYAQNATIPIFQPYIKIKSGNFNINNGSVDGLHTSSYSDINLLIKIILLKNATFTEAEKNDDDNEIKDMTKYQLLTKEFRENFLLNKWSYKAVYKKEQTFYYNYVENFKKLVHTMFNSGELTVEDKYFFQYILDIINLGEIYTNHYFTGFNPSSINEFCLSTEEISSNLNSINEKIKNANGLDGSHLKSFLNTYGFSHSIHNYNKFFYKISVKEKRIMDEFDEKTETFSRRSRSWLNIIIGYYADTKVLNKFYGFKVIDNSGTITGSFLNNLVFDSQTTPPQDTLISEGGSFDPSNKGGGIDNKEEWLEHMDNLDSDVSSFTKNKTPEEIFKESLEIPTSNEIIDACNDYLDNNFINNIVFLDINSLKLGNNHFLVKNNVNDNFQEQKKLNVFIPENVYDSLLSKIEKEHLITTIFNDVVDDSSNEFTFLNKKLNDVLYYYPKAISLSDVDERCKNLLTKSKSIRPIVIYKNDTMDVFTNSGKVADKPHDPFRKKQRIQPINSIVLDDKENGLSRETDGTIYGEIEKRLDIASVDSYGELNGEMFNNKHLQILKSERNYTVSWKPGFTIATTYYPIWYPADQGDFQNLGPVGPFFEKQEYIKKEKYEGCDLEDFDETKPIPSKIDCETINGKGTYSQYFDGKCFCSTAINLEEEETYFNANRRIKINKYCVYNMEPMKSKIRKSKYHYDHLEMDDKLLIQGFSGMEDEDGDASSLWGQMEELKGTIYSEEFLISDRNHPKLSSPLQNSNNIYSWEVNPYSEAWNLKEVIPNDEIHSCNWEEENILVNGRSFAPNSVIDGSSILNNINSDADLKRGKEIAKTFITTDKFETLSNTLCNNLNENDSCTKIVIDKLNQSDWNGLGININNFYSLYQNYLKNISKLGFGYNIVIKNPNVSILIDEPKLINNGEQWLSESVWETGEAFLFKNITNYKTSPDYNWRTLR